jgi:alpha-glucosidase
MNLQARHKTVDQSSIRINKLRVKRRKDCSMETAMRQWSRDAVIYQIYPRSFADGNGDGIGDLPGVLSRLDHLKDLGVDAIWLSPFYPSPQKDAGYDVADFTDVDPVFGTLGDFDRLLAGAHERGMRVMIDIVPNHSSSQHKWFKDAVHAGPGSPERERYIFRDGRGSSGELPPNNWTSCFGGPAWTRLEDEAGEPGQWYLHLFDSSQPDLNWDNPWIGEKFKDILRFWLDRGVDGFRVDVAHGLVKASGLPDHVVPPGDEGNFFAPTPFWNQEGVHAIFREWRQVLDRYDHGPALCGEAWVYPIKELAKWVRPDEMHQTFNFAYLQTPWNADALRASIDESLAGFGDVSAPSTWVLSNHDVVRHSTRLSLPDDVDASYGIGPETRGLPDAEAGRRRARAATLLMLGLPGSAYLYQGEELGLPEVKDIPADKRQDPNWHRTKGERYGRDGCRVPLPWTEFGESFGFNGSGLSWLPQPKDWGNLSVSAQTGQRDSTLNMYRRALSERSARGLGSGTLEWVDDTPADTLAFRNGKVLIMSNMGSIAAPLPAGRVIMSSGHAVSGSLKPDETVWLETTI